MVLKSTKKTGKAKSALSTRKKRFAKLLQNRDLIGSQEVVWIIDDAGDQTPINARIDTGAAYSSLCISIARRLKLKSIPGASRLVSNAHGTSERPIYWLNFILGNKRIKTKVTAIERRHLQCDMIVSRRNLGSFIVDPSRKFLMDK